MDETQCRCCLAEISDDAVNVMDQVNGIHIKDQLKVVCGVDISASDSLGKWICQNCEQLCTTFYTFKQKCQDTDRTLKNLERKMKQKISELMGGTAEEAPKAEIVEEETVLESIDDEMIAFEDYEMLEESKEEQDMIEYYEDDENVIEEELMPNEESDLGLSNYIKLIAGPDGSSSYSCTICQCVFLESLEENTEKIKQHTLDHENGKHHVCVECSELFEDKKELARHERRAHNQEIKLKGKVKSFDEKKILNETISKKFFKCFLCDETFQRGIHKKAHVNEAHADKAGSDCPLCIRCKIPSAVAFENHYKTHFTEPQFQCPECTQMFFEADRVQIHVKRFHSSLNFNCDVCGKTFNDKSGLSRHIAGVHLKTRKFTCPICWKPFTTNYNLKEHLFSVHKESSDSYHCVKCSQNFLYRKQFERHHEKCDGTRQKRR